MIPVCEILTPDRDRERVREWLLPSHSRFLTPESGFTIITIVWWKFHLNPDFLKATPETTPETAPDPEFSGSGVRNRDWLFKFSNPLPILKKSLPKRLPNRLPIPNFRDRESESGVRIGSDFFLTPDSHSRSRSRFFGWKSLPICQKNREWPKNEISHTDQHKS